MTSHYSPSEEDYYRPPARRTAPPDMPSNEPSKSSTKRQKTAQEEDNGGRLSRHTSPIRSVLEDEDGSSVQQEADNVNMMETQASREASYVGLSEGGEAVSRTREQSTIMSALEAIDLAEKWVDSYAGPCTKDLEKRYFEYAKSGSMHDHACLACLGDNTELKCLTCRRIYHARCLDRSFVKYASKFNTPKFQAALDSTAAKFTCPLCYKRFWHKLPPMLHASPLEREDRIMIIGSRLRRSLEALEWMEWKDDGSLRSDQKLLIRLPWIARKYAK